MTRTVIIDTDPGIDDAVALALALSSEELDVKLITCVGGNVGLDNVTNNTLKLLKFWDSDIKVAKGAANPLMQPLEDASDIHGKSGLQGYEFDEPALDNLLDDCAVEAMYNVITNSDMPVELIALGPLTNIALLLKTHPDVKDNIKNLVLMGGAYSRGNKSAYAEFNIATDPEAAYIVFKSGIDITMVGLEIGRTATILSDQVKAIKKSNKTGDMISCLFDHYRGGSLESGYRMYDPTAIAYVLNPEMFNVVDTYVEVELLGLCRGATVVDLNNKMKKSANAHVCIDIDANAFRDWFVKHLANCK